MDRDQLQGWTLPPPINGQTWGWCYTGNQPATTEDTDALAEFMDGHGDYTVDSRTLVGCWDPDYTSSYYEAAGIPPHERCGGLGSPNYQNQLLGEGIEFIGPEPGFYYNRDGRKVYGMLPYNGACHRINGAVHEGPRPGSEADRRLGAGRYVFDVERGLVVIEGGPESEE